MDTDADLPELIRRKDHLNVLRYIRLHKLREPELVVHHGRAGFGPDLRKQGGANKLAKIAALEQICLAALDGQDSELAQLCLTRISEAVGSGVEDSARFRRLQGRVLEAATDYAGAQIVYEDLCKENSSNFMALKSKYCVHKAQVGHEAEATLALNEYLTQNPGDTAAWYELAKLRQSLGDFAGACFCLEEVLLESPSDASIHCQLAECYITAGGNERAMLARRHMAQALELDPSHRRAQFGLIVAANAYLETAGKTTDEHEIAVAKELIKFGAEKLLANYKGTPMLNAVKTLVTEYKEE